MQEKDEIAARRLQLLDLLKGEKEGLTRKEINEKYPDLLREVGDELEMQGLISCNQEFRGNGGKTTEFVYRLNETPKIKVA